MINSKRKGKVGELELAHKLTDLGFNSRRSQQFKGTGDSADVVFIDPELNKILHVESKREEHLNIEKALQQSERDCYPGQIPIVCHRKNGDDWKVTLRLDHFFSEFLTRYIKKI